MIPTASTVSKKGSDDGMIVGIILAIIFIIGVAVIAIIAICFSLYKYNKNQYFHQQFMNNNETSILCTSQGSAIPMDTYDNPTYGTD